MAEYGLRNSWGRQSAQRNTTSDLYESASTPAKFSFRHWNAYVPLTFVTLNLLSIEAITMLQPLALLLAPMLAGLTSANTLWSRDAVASLSKKTTVPAQFFPKEGSKRVQVPYGPFTVPPRSEMNGMKAFQEKSVTMPCTDCLITWMQADLHYVNGTEANTNTGLWLHHTVLANTAQKGLICPENVESFYASGNERTAVDICVNGYVGESSPSRL